MFDFHNLSVYTKAQAVNQKVLSILKNILLDRHVELQLKRAAFSVVLNIAEGSGRFTDADKRHFYIIARSSVFEVVAIIEHAKQIGKMKEPDFISLYQDYEEISKMLFGMIRKYKK